MNQEQASLETNPLVILRQCLGEAKALGTTVRLSGVDVVIESPTPLPAPLQHILEKDGGRLGLLWVYLGGGWQDAPSRALLTKLGIKAPLCTTAQDARQAVRQLIRDLRQHGGHLGIDLETAPLPGFRQPRPPAKLNKDGGFSVVQPVPDDRAGLDPHLADICSDAQ